MKSGKSGKKRKDRVQEKSVNYMNLEQFKILSAIRFQCYYILLKVVQSNVLVWFKKKNKKIKKSFTRRVRVSFHFHLFIWNIFMNIQNVHKPH